jgi:hypothetical protein
VYTTRGPVMAPLEATVTPYSKDDRERGQEPCPKRESGPGESI